MSTVRFSDTPQGIWPAGPSRDELTAATLAIVAAGWQWTPLHPVRVGGVCGCHLGIRCMRPGKHAVLGRGWNRTNAPAHLDPDYIRAYWAQDFDSGTHGLALLLRWSGVACVDIDDPEAFRRMGLELPPTRWESTPRDGGGLHMFYAWPAAADGVYPAARIPGGGGEVLCNGLVVVTPSQHKSGGRYAGLDLGVPLAPAPDWIRPGRPRACALPDGLTPTGAAAIRAAPFDPGNRWVQWLLNADYRGITRLSGMRAGSGGRPAVLYAVAASLAPWTLGGTLTEAEIRADLLNACRDNGALADYGADEINRHITNGLRAGLHPTDQPERTH